MSISAAKTITIDPDAAAVKIGFSETALRLILSDGCALLAPLAWRARRRDATPAQRAHWRLIGSGHGIHWPDVDEVVSVRTLLGCPS